MNDLEKRNSLDGDDYREVHQDATKVERYEHEVYAENTLAAYFWGMEKAILAKEISMLDKDGINYLDFACGTGRIISFLEGEVAESTGVDISQNMLNVAKTKTKKTRLINADLLENNVIKDSQYDLITSFRFFLNAQEELREDMLKLLSQQLSPDGTLIFNIHGNSSSYYLILVLMNKLGIRKEKVNHMSYFNALKLIDTSGLVVQRSYGIGIVPYAFHRWFKSLRGLFTALDNAVVDSRFFKYFASNIVFVCAEK